MVKQNLKKEKKGKTNLSTRTEPTKLQRQPTKHFKQTQTDNENITTTTTTKKVKTTTIKITKEKETTKSYKRNKINPIIVIIQLSMNNIKFNKRKIEINEKRKHRNR